MKMSWETEREKGKLQTVIENVKMIHHIKQNKKKIQYRTEIMYHLVRTDRKSTI